MRKEKNQGWFIWAALVILLTAVVMRLFMLQGVPLGLARDEVRNADIVSFIRQGEHALFFRAGFGHEPLYHYFAVPFQVLLGENVFSVRLPSVFLGMLLIALVLRWAKRDFGQWAAIAAGFGLAVGWMSIVFSRIGIRPIMEPLFLVLMAWFWQKRPVVAGIFLGLSLYTYTAARVVFLIPVLFIVVQAVVWLIRTRREPENVTSLWSLLKPPTVILITAVFVSLPLFYTLQTDPSLQERVQELSGPLTALQNGDFKPIFETTWQTLGVFSFTGSPRWTYTVLGLPLFNWFTAIFFYAGLLVALWRIRFARYTLILVWLGVGLLPSAITPDAPSMIRIIGAMPVIYLLPGVALSFGRDKMNLSKISPAFSYLFLGLYLFVLTAFTISNGFVIWPSNEVTRHKYQTMLYEIGEHWRTNPSGTMVVVDDFYEPIEAASLRFNMNEDIGSRWVQTNQAAAGALVLPSDGTGLLYVPEFASPHAELMAVAGVSADDLVFRNQQQPYFAVYSLSDALDLSANFSPVLFDEKISLIGYQVSEPSDSQLQLFTFWQIEAGLPEDLAAFVHLLDAEGNLIAQHDGLDAIPLTLQVGDIVVQRHVLPLSAPLLEGSVLQAGLYLRDSGVRLTHPGDLMDRVVLRED